MKLLKPWGNSKLGLEYVGIRKLMVNFCKGLLLGISGFCFADGAGENAGGAAVVAAPVRFLSVFCPAAVCRWGHRPGSTMPNTLSRWEKVVGREASLRMRKPLVWLSWLEVKKPHFLIQWTFYGYIIIPYGCCWWHPLRSIIFASFF